MGPALGSALVLAKSLQKDTDRSHGSNELSKNWGAVRSGSTLRPIV